MSFTKGHLLILGDLELSISQLQRVNELGFQVYYLPSANDKKAASTEIQKSEYVFVNNIDIDPFLLDLKHPKLTVIAATGYNWFDIEFARKNNVRIANLRNYSTQAVVEYILWAILTSLRPLEQASTKTASGNWEKEPFTGSELLSCTCGLIGYGKIGKAVSNMLSPIAANILVTSQSKKTLNDKVCWCNFETVIKKSDIIIVCCDQNKSSAELLNKSTLGYLKCDSTVINISPNSVLNLEDFADHFAINPSMHAVLDLDPISKSHPLFSLENVRITPHIAFRTHETLQRRIDESIDLVEKDTTGGTVSLISPTHAT